MQCTLLHANGGFVVPAWSSFICTVSKAWDVWLSWWGEREADGDEWLPPAKTQGSHQGMTDEVSAWRRSVMHSCYRLIFSSCSSSATLSALPGPTLGSKIAAAYPANWNPVQRRSTFLPSSPSSDQSGFAQASPFIRTDMWTLPWCCGCSPVSVSQPVLKEVFPTGTGWIRCTVTTVWHANRMNS